MCRFMIMLAIFIAILSCKARRVNEPLNQSKTKMVTTTLNRLWKSPDFKVCWESPDDDVPLLKEEVMLHITKNFRLAGVNWNGWKACDNYQNPDVRIFIYDNPAVENSEYLLSLREIVIKRQNAKKKQPGNPHAAGVGNVSKGKKASLVLNYSGKGFSMEKFLAKMKEKLSKEINNTVELENAFKEAQMNLFVSIALHEAGHIIGLAHEDTHTSRNQEDSHSECDHFNETPIREIWQERLNLETSYNKTSIMNKCYYRKFDYTKGRLNFNSQEARDIREVMFLK